nr:testis-expressed sequence 19 protein-like isoform X2 [Microcebus murinus]
MCPPVSVRYWQQGMSYLYAAWLYDLQHGNPLKLCFACFKEAYLDFKDLLDLEDWEDEDSDSELMEDTEAGAEQEGASGTGPSLEQGPGQSAPEGSQAGGQGTLASSPQVAEGAALNHHSGPLTPVDADWTQALPWRLGYIPACSHWPSCTPSWQGFLSVNLPPGEPMVLELCPTWAVSPAETEAWLLGLQVFSMMGYYDAVYLRKMTPRWAVRTPEQHWKVLMDPKDVWTTLRSGPDVCPALPTSSLGCHEALSSALEKVACSGKSSVFKCWPFMQFL